MSGLFLVEKTPQNTFRAFWVNPQIWSFFMVLNKPQVEISTYFEVEDRFLDVSKKSPELFQKTSKRIPVDSLNSEKHSTYLQKCHRTRRNDSRAILGVAMLSKSWVTVEWQIRVAKWQKFNRFSWILKTLYRLQFWSYDNVVNMCLVCF